MLHCDYIQIHTISAHLKLPFKWKNKIKIIDLLKTETVFNKSHLKIRHLPVWVIFYAVLGKLSTIMENLCTLFSRKKIHC